MKRPSFWRFWLKNELRRPQTWFLGLLIMVGLSGVVFVDLFAQRISKTSEQDARNFVSADYTVQSWREFDSDLISKITELVPLKDQSWHQSLLASARDTHSQITNLTLEAIDGDYPFYGKWLLENEPTLRVENLRGKQEIFAEVALKNLGYKVGDTLSIGGTDFKIRDFVIEDPRSVSFMSVSAYRVWMHRSEFQKTSLAGPGSRISNRLYLRKADSKATAFREEFRKKVPDPNWRLRSAQQSNAQVQRSVGLLKSFLSFIALCGTFLGLAGIFMIFVADLRQRLPQFLTLRCLGVREVELKRSLLAPAILSVIVASVVGGGLAWYFEGQVARLLETEFNVSLASAPNPLRSLLLALATGLFASIPALSTPISRVMSIPVNRLFSGGIETSLLKANLAPRSLAMMLLVAFGLAVLLSESVRLSALNVLFVVVLVSLLYVLSRLVLSALKNVQSSKFMISYLIKSLSRQRERSLLWLLSLGFGFFFLLLGLMVSQSLQKQLRVADATGSSNLIVMGSSAEDLEALNAKLPPTVETVSYLQARIYAINGETIQEKANQSQAMVDEEGESGDFNVREYFVNVRENSDPFSGEKVVAGDEIFGPALANNVVRASFEKGFADRLGLRLGESLRLEVAGIPVEAKIVSLRSVDWFQFRPNFFISLNAEDIQGAPLNYLQLLSVADSEIPRWQSDLITSFPQLTVLDLRRTRDQILGTLDRLSLSVQGATAFLLLASFLVLVAIFLARRGELRAEFSLLRCLGVRAPQLTGFIVGESLLSAGVAWLGAFACALPGAWALTKYGLQAEFSAPQFSVLAGSFGLCVFLVLVANYAMNRRLMTQPPQELFSEI